MIILYCLRRSYIRCVDDSAIYLPYSIALDLACNNYLDSHLLAFENFFSFYNASSCLINFNFMTLPISILSSCSVHHFLCVPCPKMIRGFVSALLDRSGASEFLALITSIYCIRCVDDLSITFSLSPLK